MAATPSPQGVKYRQASPPGAGRYEVLRGDVVIGKVGRFGMGAAQFGSRWVATTPAGKRSGKFVSRDAAAQWLVQQARAHP